MPCCTWPRRAHCGRAWTVVVWRHVPKCQPNALWPRYGWHAPPRHAARARAHSSWNVNRGALADGCLGLADAWTRPRACIPADRGGMRRGAAVLDGLRGRATPTAVHSRARTLPEIATRHAATLWPRAHPPPRVHPRPPLSSSAASRRPCRPLRPTAPIGPIHPRRPTSAALRPRLPPFHPIPPPFATGHLSILPRVCHDSAGILPPFCLGAELLPVFCRGSAAVLPLFCRQLTTDDDRGSEFANDTAAAHRDRPPSALGKVPQSARNAVRTFPSA